MTYSEVFKMHNACNSGILMLQMEQLCSVCFPWRLHLWDAESLFFCETPTPGLENLGLGLQTLAPITALKNLDSDSDSRTYCVT